DAPCDVTANATRVPSGDQTGLQLHDPSRLTLAVTFLATSCSQMTPLLVFGSRRSMTTRPSSGDSATWLYSAGSPIEPRRLPLRSSHVSSVGRPAAGRNI